VRSGLQEDTIHTRLKRGWSVSRAVTEPEKYVRERGPRSTLAAVEVWRTRTSKLRSDLIAEREKCKDRIDEIDSALAELPEIS
jgi:hypothetical protein